MLNFYKKLCRLKRTDDTLINGSFALLENKDGLFVYERRGESGSMIAAGNFGGEEKTYALPEQYIGGEVILSS